MSRPLAIATRGLQVGRREPTAVGPGRSCITLMEVGANFAKFDVTPPADVDYDGSLIQYSEVGTCLHSEAGPEMPSGELNITGLTPGTIYTFMPVSFDDSGNIGKPGNIILATVPINIIDMPDLELNSCGLEDVWKLIYRKVDQAGLRSVLGQLDQQMLSMSLSRERLWDRITRLEAQVAALNRKV